MIKNKELTNQFNYTTTPPKNYSICYVVFKNSEGNEVQGIAAYVYKASKITLYDDYNNPEVGREVKTKKTLWWCLNFENQIVMPFPKDKKILYWRDVLRVEEVEKKGKIITDLRSMN